MSGTATALTEFPVDDSNHIVASIPRILVLHPLVNAWEDRSEGIVRRRRHGRRHGVGRVSTSDEAKK